MRLRDALDLCTDDHVHEWIAIPTGQWGRPATTMVVGMFDPGASEPDMRPLTGHSLAVYEPDARLSLVWPMPEDDRSAREDVLPEWAEQEDLPGFKTARGGWTMVLLSGTPIWQVPMWYLDWGSGIGGYVAHFHPRFGKDDEHHRPTIAGWEVSEWEVAITRLINSFSHTDRDWATVDPTPRIVPNPSKIHPTDFARRDH